jgi:hypothetical protein
MSSSKTTPYLLRNKKQPPVGVVPQMPQPSPKTCKNRKLCRDNMTSGKKIKKEDKDEKKEEDKDEKKEEEKDEKEEEEKEEEEEEEEEEEYTPYMGRKIHDKDCITANQLENEMKQVLCHAFEICSLWVSYTRARGEMISLEESRNPKEKAALRYDLYKLREKYSKKSKDIKKVSGPHYYRWIGVLRRLMMVQVQENKDPYSPPPKLGKDRNVIVEHAREIYHGCQMTWSDHFENVCHAVEDMLDKSPVGTKHPLPEENKREYHNWFKKQRKYKDWTEEELEHQEEEEEEEDKKPAAK